MLNDFAKERSCVFALIWVLVSFLIFFPTKLCAADVAFFYALDKDYSTLAAMADRGGQSVKVGSHVIARLTIGSNRIFTCKMNSGAVESALSANTLLSKFHCDMAFAIGPAGALSDSAPIGKWFQVSKIFAYQHGSEDSTGFVLAPNAIQTLAVPPHSINLPSLFKNLPDWDVASGETFVLSAGFRQRIQDLTHADTVDMNLYGLAAACADFKVPLYCWRVVSDHADEHAGDDFRKFTTDYDGAGARAIGEIIRFLPQNPISPTSYPGLRNLLDNAKATSP